MVDTTIHIGNGALVCSDGNMHAKPKENNCSKLQVEVKDIVYEPGRGCCIPDRSSKKDEKGRFIKCIGQGLINECTPKDKETCSTLEFKFFDHSAAIKEKLIAEAFIDKDENIKIWSRRSDIAAKYAMMKPIPYNPEGGNHIYIQLEIVGKPRSENWIYLGEDDERMPGGEVRGAIQARKDQVFLQSLLWAYMLDRVFQPIQ
jgi:hypothetical protein